MTTKDQVAQLIIGEAKKRNHTRDECLAEMSALYQESEWNETVWDSTHVTYGVAQQDGSYPHRFDGAAAQIHAFFDKLDAWRNKPGASGDIWLNICWMQQAPNWDSAAYWWEHGRQAYLTEIKSRIATVTPYLNKYWPATGGIVVSDNRPDFNEINKIGIENGSHSSIRSQLPKNWFIHTQQGNGNAEDLFNFLMSTSGNGAVSYHYAIAEDRNDHGVTVVDVCDTDRYSWSVLNANVFSINACFAGSFAEQTRDQWLANYRNAIRVAAYLAVQDCKKYPTIAAVVIPPPYVNHGSGISDHRFVTDALGIGSHVDVGGPMNPPWNGFPWDVFTADVQSFLVPVTTGPNTPPPSVDTTPLFSYPTTDQMTKQLWEQAFGPQAKGWESLFGKTADGKRGKFTVEAIGDLHKAGA
jgi:hypothetical protein